MHPTHSDLEHSPHRDRPSAYDYEMHMAQLRHIASLLPQYQKYEVVRWCIGHSPADTSNTLYNAKLHDNDSISHAIQSSEGSSTTMTYTDADATTDTDNTTSSTHTYASASSTNAVMYFSVGESLRIDHHYTMYMESPSNPALQKYEMSSQYGLINLHFTLMHVCGVHPR